ncbi:YXWGXW repeat-containing protein [candidate division FCPU426 bacterium]|nr:YXWGXW repeat-containing protein [candidate division FCPU426 bacterium]
MKKTAMIAMVLTFSAVLAAGCSIHVIKRSDSPYTQRPYYAPTPYTTYVVPQDQPEPYANDPAPAPAYSAQSNPPVEEYQEAEPDEVVMTIEGPDRIWVDAIVVADDIVIPGFWRPRLLVDFSWVDGRWEGGIYFPGFWLPRKHIRSGYVWVPGYWHAGTWIKGRWRLAQRPGYTWVDAHWTHDGFWVYGCWKPTRLRPGYVWEPGYWDRRGNWRDGFWRPEIRKGYVWVYGRYNNQGDWFPGAWKYIPKGKVWVHGYWDDRGGWKEGFFRDETRPGQRFTKGHYNPKGYWVPGQWQSEKEEQPAPQYGTGTYGKKKTMELTGEKQPGRSKVQDTIEKEEAWQDQQQPKSSQAYSGNGQKKSKVREIVVEQTDEEESTRVKNRSGQQQNKGRDYSEPPQQQEQQKQDKQYQKGKYKVQEKELRRGKTNEGRGQEKVDNSKGKTKIKNTVESK